MWQIRICCDKMHCFLRADFIDHTKCKPDFMDFFRVRHSFVIEHWLAWKQSSNGFTAFLIILQNYGITPTFSGLGPLNLITCSMRFTQLLFIDKTCIKAKPLMMQTHDKSLIQYQPSHQIRARKVLLLQLFHLSGYHSPVAIQELITF